MWLSLLMCAKAADVQDARDFYASQPEYLQPLPPTTVPEGLQDLRASTCGGCHTEIYAEWQISTHARAWLDDAQFQAELHKSVTAESDVGWMCVNCHTPNEAQLPRLVAGLREGRLDQPIYVDNPDFDPALQLEAVTCATCHVRDGAVLGPYGDTAAPHATRKLDELRTTETCTVCHQANATFESINLACRFDTGAEHAAGPHAESTCQSCHMPEIERPLVDGGEVRSTRRHWFGGSLIPKHPDHADEVAALAEHYPHGLSASWTLPDALVVGENALAVSVRNDAAGHKLPTGDPERYVLVKAEVRAAEQVIGQLEHRIGTVYQWYPRVELVSDNRLLPAEERALPVPVTVPPGTSEVTLTLVVEKWRISPENLAYHQLEETVPSHIVVLDETRTLPVGP